MAIQPESLRVSFDEFFAWEAMQPLRYEFADGRVFAMAGASRAHGSIATNIVAALHPAVRNRGCGLYSADMKVAIPDIPAVRYPDIVVTCDERDLQDEQITRFPVLLIEIVSSSTEALDRGEKFAEYRELSSLIEFVLVDSRTVHVEVFRRRDGNRWLFLEYGPGDEVELESVEARVSIDALYEGLRLGRTRRTIIE